VFTGSGSTNTGFSVDLNQWQHLAAVFIPGTGVRFYKNGNLFSTSTISYDASDNNINLGRNPMNSEFFQGRIDEARVWNIQRSQAEIISTLNKKLTGNETGLRGYWNFDNETANDFSGNNYNGTLNNGASIGIPNAPVLEKWLNYSPVNADTIFASDSSKIPVTISSTGLGTGQYTTYMVLNSNDPLKPNDTVQVVLNVNGTPEIFLTKNCIYLDSIMEYTTSKDSLYVKNIGCDTLQITNITKQTSEFTINTTSATLAPGDSVKLVVIFAPTSVGTFNDTLKIFSNAGDSLICLSGKAFARPVVSAAPDTIKGIIASCQDSIDISLTIYNSGGSDLIWNITSTPANVNVIPFPSADTTASADSTLITVRLKDTGLSGGTYNYTIKINSNDPLTPVVNIPVILTVDTVLPSAPVASDTAICFGQTTPDLIAVGDSIRWYSDGALTTMVHSGDTFATGETSVGIYTYYVTQTLFSTGCQSIADTVVLQISTAPGQPTATDTTVCSDATIPSLSSTGTIRKWYADGTLTTLLFTGNPFSTGQTAPGSYNYYVTDSTAGCPASPADTSSLVINQAATVDAGISVDFICEGSPYTLSGSMGGSASTILWTTSGDGTFDDNTSLTATYTPGTTDISNGSVDLTITSNDPDGAGPCGQVSDLITITIMPAATADAGIDSVICEGSTYTLGGSFGGGASSASWTTSGTGTFNNASSLTATYTPSAADISAEAVKLYLTTNDPAGPCPAVTDSMMLTINLAAVVNAGADTAICTGQTYTLAGTKAGSTSTVSWTTSGDGTFDDNTLLAATYTPGATDISNGTVTLTITSNDPDGVGPCAAVADNMVLTINSTPAQPTGTDTTVCSDVTIPVLSATGTTRKWYADGSLTTLLFTGNPFNTGQTAAGVYTYYVTDSLPACPASDADTVVLTINQAATVNAGSNDTICEGNTYTLAGTMGGSASSITWSSSGDGTFDDNTLLAATYTPGATDVSNGTVTLTITSNDPDGSGPCFAVVSSMILKINPEALVNAGIDSVICEGSTYTLAGIIGGSASSASWTTSGTGTFNNSSSLTATYTPSAADISAGSVKLYLTTNDPAGPCPAVTDSMMLTINPAAVVNAGADTAICTGQTYTLVGTTAGSTSTVSWTTSGDGTFDDNTLLAATYTPGASDLSNGTVTLTITSNDPDGAGPCAAVVDNMVLTINSTPSTPLASDTAICFGQSTPNLIAGGTLVKWYSDPTLNTFVFSGNSYASGQTASGTYNYYVTDSVSGCPASDADTATLVINPLPAAPTANDTAICFGSPTPDLTATGDSVRWYSDGTLTTLVNNGNNFATGKTAVGSYIYYVTQTNLITGCQSAADTVTLTIKAIPSAPVSSDTASCEGSTVPDLTAAGTNIIWYSDGTLTTQVGAGNNYSTGQTASGTYFYYLTQTVNGCTGLSDTVSLVINAVPSVPIAPDTTVCQGQTVPDLTAAGSNVTWYSDSALTTQVGAGNSFTSGQTNPGSYSYFVTQTVNSCQSIGKKVTLTILPVPSAPVAADTSVCYGQTVPDLTASGTNLKWYSDAGLTTLVFSGNPFATGQTNVGNYTYYVTDSLNSCGQAPSTAVTLTIDTLPSAPAVSNVTVCEGDSVPPLSATGTSVKWYSDSDLTNLVFSGNPFNTGKTAPGIYDYYVTSSVAGCGEGAATKATLTINSLPSAPVAANDSACEGNIIPNLTASGTGIVWYSDSALTTQAGTGNSFNTGQTSAGVYSYYATQTDSVTGCQSLATKVTLTIKPVPSSPVANNQNAVEGGTIPDLTATGSNLEWYSDSALTVNVASGNTFTTGQTAAGVYTYYVTQSSNGCTSSATTVTLTIYPGAPTAADTSACFGQAVPELSASGSNIKWYSDSLATLVFTGNPYNTGQTAAGTYTYYVSQTVNGLESPGTAVTLTITTLPSAPVVSADTSVCQNQTNPAFNAAGTNIIWYSDAALSVNIGSGNSYTSPQATVGSYTYYATQNPAGCESSSDSVMLTINPAPGKPAGMDSSVCFGGTVPDLFATGSNINWYSDAGLTTLVNTGNTFNTGQTAAGTYNYYVTDSLNGCFSTSDTVTLLISTPSNAPTGAVSNIDSVCPGSNVVLYAQGTASTGTQWTWYNGSCGGLKIGAGDSITVSQSSTTTYFVRAEGGCDISACVNVTINVTKTTSTAPASLSASANTICAGNSTTLTVNGGSLGTNANWQWYENSCGGISAGSGVTISVSPATSKMFYARAEGTCNTTVCDSVFINVNSAPPAPATTDTTVCEGQAVPDLTATGNNIKWYADSALTQLLDTGNAFATGQTAAGIYSYYVNDSTGVCAGPASIAALTINSIPQAPNAFDATGCENGIIPNLTATGTSINWYDDAVMSNLLGIGNSFATGQTNAGNYTYYATETINGCESPADSATLTILSGIAAPAASDKSACEGTNIPSLSSSGSNVSWYSDPSLTTLVNTGNSFNTGQTAAGVYTYYVTDSLSGCASSADTATLTIIAAPPAPVGNDTSICYGQPVPDLNATGNNINWYNEPALIIWVGSGNSYSTGQTNVGNYSYYITQTVNGCTSISDTVTLVINPAPLVTVNPAVANISPGDSVVINAYNANSYTWSPPTGLNTTTGSTVIAKPTVTTTYTVTGDNGKGCSGSATVTINVWPVGINDNVSISQSLNIYPNPARTQLFLEFYSGKATAVDLNIVNSLGQNVIQKRLLPEKGFYSQVFDVHTLPAGVYHLQLSDGNEIISKRLVIQ
jgi:hypothetical protein